MYCLEEDIIWEFINSNSQTLNLLPYHISNEKVNFKNLECGLIKFNIKKGIILLHRDNFHHEGQNYEILLIKDIECKTHKELLGKSDEYYSILKEYFITNALHLIHFPNQSYTYFCFPAADKGFEKWKSYSSDFNQKLKNIENKLSLIYDSYLMTH
jgi:hypothetical protein